MRVYTKIHIYIYLYMFYIHTYIFNLLFLYPLAHPPLLRPSCPFFTRDFKHVCPRPKGHASGMLELSGVFFVSAVVCHTNLSQSNQERSCFPVLTFASTLSCISFANCCMRKVSKHAMGEEAVLWKAAFATLSAPGVLRFEASRYRVEERVWIWG